MNQPIYEYTTEGKTLVSLFFLFIAIAAVVIGANSGAPIYWYIPIGFALLFGAWWFMNNPNNGCKLTEETLELWSNKEKTTIIIADIDHVSVKEWMDGPDNISLVMKDSSKNSISYLQYGNTDEFKRAFENAGLKIETVS